MNNTSNQNIEENLNSIDYNYINFIHSETQTLGNYLIWISTTIILLSTDIISISEIEFNGLKIDIKKEYISYILFVINTYYFVRFYFLLSFDNLNFKMPKQVDLIINEAKEKVKYYSAKITKHKNEIENLTRNGINNNKEITNLQKQIDNDFTSLKYFLELLEKTEAKLVIGNKHLRNNNLINGYFPKIMFLASLTTVLISIFRLCYKYC